jgi:L-malate glycosyltransferase
VSLIVLVPDRLSAIVEKGEITPRYYNPGDLFGEVHLVLVNDDAPDPEALAPTVGRARLVLHNLPPPRRMFARTLGYRPALVRRWAAEGVELAREVRPELVRCHGTWVNAFAASEIKRELGIPYAVSVHNIATEDVLAGAGWEERLRRRAIRGLERTALRDADLVLPVYSSIVPYLESQGVTRIRVAPNALNPRLRRKDDYALHRPARVISVGRLIGGKNPEQLVRAVGLLEEVELTVVGDGDLYEPLAALAEEVAPGRVSFRRAVSNDELCDLLREQDVFATHNDYWGVPKAVMEAMLAGLPALLNRAKPLPELPVDAIHFVANTPEGWAHGLRGLLSDAGARERLGHRAADHAWSQWAPDRVEALVAGLYEELLDARARS